MERRQAARRGAVTGRARLGPVWWRPVVRACVALAGAATLWCQVGAITPAGAVTRSPEDQSGKLGYWVVRADGSVTGFGLASLGDLSRVKLPSPIVGGAAVPRGGGYWLVAANGGVYSFGSAAFAGSLPGLGVRITDGVDIGGV